MCKALKFFSAGLLSLVVCGCGNSNSTINAPGTGNGSLGSATNVSVTLSPSGATTIDAGQTVALTATISGDTGKGVTWTVNSGGTLASTTGLTNTYTAPAAATPSVTITATSILDPTKFASTTVAVNALPAFSFTGQLPQAYAGIAYSTTLASTGGTGTRTYALSSGSLPAGLSLNTSTGVISGTPTTSGSSTFSVSVTDSAATPAKVTASFTIGVSALQIVPPTFTDTVVGRAYPTVNLTSAYAQGTVTYAVTSGALPAGLTLSSAGVLSGSATAAGTSTFTITATDAAGQTATTTGSIKVASVLQFSGATLPQTTANTVFAGYTVAATGGTSPYTYRVAEGSSLPAGLTLSATGAIAGTPATPGNYTFSIIASDSNGAVTATSQSATAVFSLNVPVAPLSFTTTTLPNAVPGSPYLQSLAATGGIAPYTFTVASGSLPSGMFLNQAGAFSGRASTAGTYNFTVQVTDTEGSTPQVVSQPFTLVVSNTLTPGTQNALLKGSYGFVFHGVSNGALATGAVSSGNVFGADMAGSLTFDGTSLITGKIDLNSAFGGVQTAIAVTGSYAVGDDHRGQVVLQYGSNTVTLDLAAYDIVNNVANKFRFIEADADNAINVNQVQGPGEAALQTPTDFNMTALTGHYVFSLKGETPSPSALSVLNETQPGVSSQFGALAAAGYISLNGAGLIVRGSLDASSYNTAYPLISLAGSYTAPDSSGRGTMVINTIGNGYPGTPTNYVYYVINAKQIVLLSTDPHTSLSLMAGMAYQQQQTLYTTASLSGTIIGSESAVRGGDGVSAFPGTLSATFYVLRVTGAGTMSAYTADNTNGVLESFVNSPDPLTYSVSDTGRVTLLDQNAPSAQLPVFWLYDNNLGVGTELENSAGPIGTLQLEGQTAATFNNASINGLYASGVDASVAPVSFAGGVINATTGSTATLVQDSTSNAVITSGNTVNLTKAVEAGTGRFSLTGTNVFYNGYVLSPTKLIYFDAVSGFTRPVIHTAEK